MYSEPTEKDITHTLRAQLTQLIKGGSAHATMEKALAGIPFAITGQKPHGLPYSLWQLAEHLRITQRDILDYCRDPEYRSPEWPAGYWPQSAAPANPDAWEQCLQQIHQDQQDFLHFLNNPNHDLYAPFMQNESHNLLREALLVADHNSYHTGEVIVLRRLLGEWEG